MSILVCRDLELSYDGRRNAVDKLTLEVEEGSLLALVGPNGAGKTSTLRMMATLQEPTSGTLSIAGADVKQQAALARERVGYLPDHFALYDAMTPVGYLEFFARLYGVADKERGTRIEQLLTEFDLLHKQGERISSLSRGMRQRLGIAKTLIHQPKLLLLDEPASALDPGARMRLRDVLLGLKKRGLAMVVSSHILPDLAELADKVAILEGGRLVRYGKVHDVADGLSSGRIFYTLEVGDAERTRKALDQLGGRVGEIIEHPGGRFEIELDGGRDTVAELVEKIVLVGGRLYRIAPKESALESIYRQSAAVATA